MDYIYPLPKQALHARYDPIFAAFQRGLSSGLIGLPLSARSGYLKFILEYSQEFLAEFIDPKTYHFIVIEGEQLSADKIIALIATKLLAFNIFSPISQSELENRLKIHDSVLTLASIKNALSIVYPQHKFVIVIYEAEKLLDNNSQAINSLVQLWNTNRNQPNTQVHLCFIGSPVLLDKANSPMWSPIRPALQETIVHFPLFSAAEMQYLRRRLEHLSGTAISEANHKLAAKLAAGHTVLYQTLVKLPLTELKGIEVTHTHPAINGILETVWSGVSLLDKQNSNLAIPLLPPTMPRLEIDQSGNTIPQLTAQQKLIFDYLTAHSQQIVSRDEIAQVIWGKNWQEKYSDWAIDRSISNLKLKLKSTSFQILTIRNRGYKLGH